jgi:hypothetical protein
VRADELPALHVPRDGVEALVVEVALWKIWCKFRQINQEAVLQKVWLGIYFSTRLVNRVTR